MRTGLSLVAACTVILSGCLGSESAPLAAKYPVAAARILSGPGFAAREGAFVRAELMDPAAAADPVKAAEGALARRGGLELRLPVQGADAATLTLPGGSVVTVRERGLVGPARVVAGALTYARADGNSYWSVTADGFEEWIEVANAGAGPVAEWDVTGASLRQVGDAVELVDAQGAARARVKAPRAYEAGGAEKKAWLRVEGGRLALFTDARGAAIVDPVWTTLANMVDGRSAHTATLLPNGKVLVAGGLGNSVGLLATAELFDPATGTWAATGSLAQPRAQHTAVLLPSGRVLVSGGSGPSGYLATAEIYEPAAGTWSPTGPMTHARGSHTATLLGSGKVLVAGGYAVTYPAVAELFDPAAGTWSTTGSLGTGRSNHSATLLPSGKVLVAGGTAGFAALLTAQLYDPADGSWGATGSMSVGRWDHTATLVPSGQVVVIGGRDAAATASVELYDPGLGAWTTTGAGTLVAPRYQHTATLLPSGKVLVACGQNGTNNVGSAELFDPVAGSWTWLQATSTTRRSPTATLLPSGQVLLAGGEGIAYYFDTAEIYDVAAGSWTATGSLAEGRGGHTATLLGSGKVLVAGGVVGGSTYLSSAELYDPSAGTWAATGSLATGRTAHTATLLPDGKVLVTGGWGSGGGKSSVELYDPATGLWGPTGALAGPRDAHTATLLPAGRVLVAGGHSGVASLATAEIYDSATGLWSGTGSLPAARYLHTGSLLPSGKVLLAGGIDGGGATSSALLYDPAAGSWTATGSLATPRAYHAATTLPSGKVLVTGGSNAGALASAEIFNPATGTWSSAGSLATARQQHAAALLPSGRVIVVGGSGGSPAIAEAELFDPIAGTWSPTSSLGAARKDLTASVLPSGKVLVAAGQQGIAYLAGAELFELGNGVQAGWTPTLTTVPAGGAVAGGSIALNGTLFTGVSEGSGGNSQSSATNFPLVQLRSVDGGAQAWATLSAFTAATATASVPATFPPGPAWARVVVNGVPSAARPFSVLSPVVLSPAAPSISPKASVTFTASGGSGTGYAWSFDLAASGGSFVSGSTWKAGATGGVTDWIRVTDSLGNHAIAVVSVTAGVTISPATASAPPLGSATFTAVGGSGTGFTWSMAAQPSGGSIDSSGLYTAGAVGGVTDTVRVTDDLGNVATRDVTVGANLSITPASGAVAPGESVDFNPVGGGGTFTWSFTANTSGATLDTSTGVYRAGRTGSVTDTVQVADSLGNVASRSVTVTAAVSIAPTSSTIPPRGSQVITPSGGSGSGYTYDVVTNLSGGSFSGSTYAAGPTGNVTDVVRVTDSLGNTATRNVTVSAGVTITPPSMTLISGKTWTFTASGGSGAGWTWGFVTNSSNAFIGTTTGLYQAGTIPNVSDTIQVTDSLGNSATAVVTVTPAAPDAKEGARSAYGCSSTGGGSGSLFLFGLTALALTRARRRAGRALLALALAVPLAAGAAPAKDQKTRVAVMPIKGGLGIEPKLAELVTDALVAELTDRGLTVITSKDVESALGFEKQKQMLGCGDESCLAEIAGALGADRVVSGDIAQVRELTVFSVQVFNTRVGAVEKRFHERMSGGEAADLLDATERAGAALFPGTVRSGTATRKKSVLTSTARPLALVARGGYDVEDSGGYGMLGIEYRVSRSVRLGLGGLGTGARTAGAAVRVGWYPLVFERLSLYGAAEAHLLFASDMLVAANVALGMEWAFSERFAMCIEVPLTLMASAPAEYRTTYFMPGMSASWRF